MKILASDYDSTLRVNGEIPQENTDAVRRWQAAGNLFVVVTGRMSPPAELLEADLCDAVLTCSGGRVRRKDGKILSCYSGDGELVAPLVKFLCGYDGTKTTFAVRSDNFGEERIAFADIDFEHLHKLGGFNQVSCEFESRETAAKFCAEAEKLFPGIEFLPNGVNVDMPPRGMNKAVGIRRYAGIYGVPDGDIYTVGDDMNDFLMLRAFNGYAMSHGSKALLEKIPHSVPSVAALIDKII